MCTSGAAHGSPPTLSTWLGHRDPRSTHGYLYTAPELPALTADRFAAIAGGNRPMRLVTPTLQSFSTDRLASSARSARALASYLDSLKLLVFCARPSGKAPCALDWEERRSVGSLTSRGRTPRGTRTRNPRLTAPRSLYAYACMRHPEHAALIQRVHVLAVPRQAVRPARRVVPDCDGDLGPHRGAPTGRWEGRQDHALLGCRPPLGFGRRRVGLGCHSRGRCLVYGCKRLR
jgi:hypothetical protein